MQVVNSSKSMHQFYCFTNQCKFKTNRRLGLNLWLDYTYCDYMYKLSRAKIFYTTLFFTFTSYNNGKIKKHNIDSN